MTSSIIQAGEEGAPPLVGFEGEIIFFAFLIVVLLVPWLMSRQPSGRGSTTDGKGSTTPTLVEPFSSGRERELWIWALLTQVAIYSTLSPAQHLAAALRERNLLEITTTAFLLLVGAIIAARWARTRPGRREVGAALGVLAVYLATLTRMPVPEARSHLFEYGLVATLIYHALLERRINGRSVPAPALTAAVVTGLLGWLDEGIQALLPNRVYDITDVGLNVAFALMAIVANVVMAWARKLDVLRRLGVGARRAG